jgi:UDP-N-acetylmuramate: L-alanyl-gamma-D-glutamyl-meso-diaminopimelate ligase
MNPVEHIHLLGIGGSAMAPMAGMLKERGYHVTGSDVHVYPPASTLLGSLGISWFDGYAEEHVTPAPDLVVVGNALSRGNPEVEAVLDRGIPYCSLPEILKNFFLPGRESIVVSGTHGKTTTTSMLAWVFHSAGRQPSFLIGGVAENFGRSYGLGEGKEFILEGDEYDSAFFDKGPKFLHYRPDELIITSLEFDHADIYPDLASIELQFRRLVNLVPRRGRIFVWGDDPRVPACAARALCPVETYGFTPFCDWCAGDLETVNGETTFRVAHRGDECASIRLPMVGRFNVLNALAASALALGHGIPRDALENALAEFRGVRRRLEVRGEVAGIAIVDDFAHHPTAIRETLQAARLRWPGRRLWAVVEPRSNTMRRKIFETLLPDALAGADVVVIGPVNRPHLLSDADRLSPDAVVDSLRAAGRQAHAFGSAREVADYLVGAVLPSDVVLVMSNGDFDGLCNVLLEKLTARSGVSR